MIKVLNGYAGIGGNRKLWKNVEVTAIEYDKEIASIYQELYPDDKVIVQDAREYLLKHYNEFDFIWLSPPCPTHSHIRKELGVDLGKYEAKYPDMGLYEQIIFLQHFHKGKWVVENVVPYYKPLLPAKKLDRHLFWSNFPLNEKRFNIERRHHDDLGDFKKNLGVDLDKYKLDSGKKRAIYRNCVDSKLGLFVFDMAFINQQLTLEGECS